MLHICCISWKKSFRTKWHPVNYDINCTKPTAARNERALRAGIFHSPFFSSFSTSSSHWLAARGQPLQDKCSGIHRCTRTFNCRKTRWQAGEWKTAAITFMVSGLENFSTNCSFSSCHTHTHHIQTLSDFFSHSTDAIFVARSHRFSVWASSVLIVFFCLPVCAINWQSCVGGKLKTLHIHTRRNQCNWMNSISTFIGLRDCVSSMMSMAFFVFYARGSGEKNFF